MQQETRKTLYDMHSWAGVFFGLFLYVVSFTGVVSLFQKELWRWDIRLPAHVEEPAKLYKINDPVRAIINRYPTAGEISVEMPHYYNSALKIVVIPNGVWTNNHFNPETGESIGQSGEGLARFLRTIHTDLWLPSPYGRYFVSLMGVLMLFSVTSGIFIHGHLIKKFFTFRPNRSHRLLLTDGHKGLGLWGLLFNGFIAYTGALLGLSGILVSIMAFAVFDGDVGALRNTVLGETPRAAKIEAQMMDLDILADRARSRWLDGIVKKAYIRHPKDKNGFISFTVQTPETDNALTAPRKVTYNIITGEELTTLDPLNKGIGYRIDAAIAPLHYATYGGAGLKFLYALLGIGSSLTIVTGIMLWVNRRTNSRTKPTKSYAFLCSVSIGICAGFPLATVASFYTARLSALYMDYDRVFWIGVVYFTSLICAVAYAWRNDQHANTTIQLLKLTAVLCLTEPAMNYATTGEGIITYLRSDNVPALTVDLTFLIFGLLLFKVARIVSNRYNQPALLQTVNCTT